MSALPGLDLAMPFRELMDRGMGDFAPESGVARMPLARLQHVEERHRQRHLVLRCVCGILRHVVGSLIASNAAPVTSLPRSVGRFVF
jgi:hypothetical protein